MTFRGIQTVNDTADFTKKKGQSKFLADLNSSLNGLSQAQRLNNYVYYPRNVTEPDFSAVNGNLISDSGQHALELSQIITHNSPTLVVIRVEARSATTGLALQVWPILATSNQNRVYIYTQATNIPIMGQFTLPIDSRKQLLYQISTGTYTVCQIIVQGWWGV